MATHGNGFLVDRTQEVASSNLASSIRKGLQTRLLHKALSRGFAGLGVCRFCGREALVLAGGSRSGGSGGVPGAPELEEVVGGGDQLPFGLAGA